MKELFEQVIRMKNYDLKSLLNCIDQYHIEGRLTDAERLELTQLAREGAAPEYDYKGEIDALWAAVRALQQSTTQPDEKDEWPEYVQPTGAGTAYQVGDKITFKGERYNGVIYTYIHNLQGDIVGLLDNSGALVVEYRYDAWGKAISTTGSLAETLGKRNPFRYRGYIYDEETGLYYLRSRYYNPTVGRFVNADAVEYLGMDGELLSYNQYLYCRNSPNNRFDADGSWSLPNWAKVAIGAVATVAAVAVTVATGGAAAPVLAGVAATTIGWSAGAAIAHRITTGGWDGVGEAVLDGAADGFMLGGLGALGGSVIGGAIRTIKNARARITIGKMGQFERDAELAQTRHYSGLKEFGFIKKIFGTKAAEAVGWWQNKCVVKGVMLLKGAIYDCGGELTGAYAKEVALTKGYKYLFNVWLM